MRFYQTKASVYTIIGFFVALFLVNSSVYGQSGRYPVSGNLVIGGSMSSYNNLSYYAAGGMGADVLLLNVTLNDFSLSGQPVGLQLKLKGMGLSIQSKQEIEGATALRLDGGFTHQLTLQDLSAYFKITNLQHIDEAVYNNLPEGHYELSFQVIDEFTKRPLSDWITGSFNIQYNSAPQLRLPETKSNVKGGDFMFLWLNNGAVQQSYIDYEFRLYKLFGSVGSEVAEVKNTPIPFFQKTVTGTSLNSLDLPPLEEGGRYAWLVQAKAQPGYEAVVGGFKKATTGAAFDPGFSELYTFLYQGNCQGVTNVQLEAKSNNRIAVSWAPDSRYSFYLIKYRKAGGNHEWFEDSTSNSFFTIEGLEPATRYEVMVGVWCGSEVTGIIAWSDIQVVQTLAAGEVTGVNCGTIPTIDISNQQLIEKLNPGDIVIAGDFKMTLTKVEGSSEGWSGDAYTQVPLFMDTKWRMSFQNIKVNGDKKLVAGFFETFYDEKDNAIIDIDEVVDAIEDVVAEIGDLLDNDFANADNWLESIKDQVKYLPDEWQEKLALTENELAEAKEAYELAEIAVKELGENATAEDKEKAEKAFKEAKEKYEASIENAKATKEELKEFLKEYTDLLKWVFRVIRDESLHFRDKYRSYVQNLIEGKPVEEAEKTESGEELGIDILFSEEADKQQQDSKENSINNKPRDSREFIWNRSVYASRKMDEWKTQEGFLKFIDDFKQITGKNISQIVYDLQKQDKSDDDIVKEGLKPELYAVMMKLFELESAFIKQDQKE